MCQLPGLRRYGRIPIQFQNGVPGHSAAALAVAYAVLPCLLKLAAAALGYRVEGSCDYGLHVPDGPPFPVRGPIDVITDPAAGVLAWKMGAPIHRFSAPTTISRSLLSMKPVAAAAQPE
mgnify:CR=1 FL=1